MRVRVSLSASAPLVIAVVRVMVVFSSIVCVVASVRVGAMFGSSAMVRIPFTKNIA
jgi:hypothetical protein